MSVDVEVRGEVLEVYYNRALRARFDCETGGEQLPLDEVDRRRSRATTSGDAE